MSEDVTQADIDLADRILRASHVQPDWLANQLARHRLAAAKAMQGRVQRFIANYLRELTLDYQDPAVKQALLESAKRIRALSEEETP